MRLLIVDDDFMIRRVLKEILTPYGDCDVVTDGNEALQAFRLAWEDNEPYDLICLDIMMPDMDGHQALQEIRDLEKKMAIAEVDEVKVIMISALDDPKNVMQAYLKGGATSYIVKPIEKEVLVGEIRKLGLIE